MCSYLLGHSGGTYYFRMSIPLAQRPFMGGKREIKHSLGAKDRDVAKAMIPDHTKAALDQLRQARDALDAVSRPKKSKAQLEREGAWFLFQEEQAELASRDLGDRESEIEEPEPIMDALAAGKQAEASRADVARVDLDEGLWTVPAVHMKRNKAHVVALSRAGSGAAHGSSHRGGSATAPAIEPDPAVRS